MEHQTFDFLDTFLSGFQMSGHVIRLTIWTPDIFDYKQTFFWFSDHHLKTRPFDNQTHLDHSNLSYIQMVILTYILLNIVLYHSIWNQFFRLLNFYFPPDLEEPINPPFLI